VLTVLLGLVTFMVVVALLGLATGLAGADTRHGNDWSVHRHA
jgi:hypothetical protein